MPRGQFVRTKRTHCVRGGHEYTPENTRVRVDGSRQCRTCDREKKRIDFSTRTVEEIERQRSRDKAPHRVRKSKDTRYRRVFGLSLEDAEKMAEAQGGICANPMCDNVCNLESKGPGDMNTFVVDHDHITGKVRELLCHRCNKALGMVQDDPKVLLGLLQYLEKHQ